MKRLTEIALLMLAAAPAPAAAEIRAVFVGIDSYLYSRTHVESADFKDLRGAVNDSGRIKDALRTAYALDLDKPSAGKCRSANPVSITLTNECATRAAILEALDAQIKASKPGDTLLFYFAGHGSRFIDDQVLDQASGYNATILPADARKPGATVPTDIMDREIGEILDQATAASINVVTIFDSCNSGTATRSGLVDGESRKAPPLRVRQAQPVTRSKKAGHGGGYRVHLAAAADDEEAHETGPGAVRAGIFTTALAKTLVAMPDASFADIAAEVRLKVDEVGHPAQNPQAEGNLQASLLGGGRRVPLFEATPGNGQVLLASGQITGITAGSTFALFASTTEALKDGARPLAMARVVKVEAARATLALEAGNAGALPSRLVARETAHAFGEQTVLVRNAVQSPRDRTMVAAAIAEASPVARQGEPAQLAITKGDGEYELLAGDGTKIAGLGSPTDPGFAERLKQALQEVARAQALIALRTDPSKAEVSFCIASSEYDVSGECPRWATPAGPVLKANDRVRLSVVNEASVPRYIYVFAVDEEYDVTLLLPPNGGRDPPVPAGQPLKRDIPKILKGQYKFVTISTDAPINAAALEQQRQGTRNPAGCVSPLERLLCDAATGSRDPSIPRVGNWSAIVSPAIAIDPKDIRN